MAYEDDILTKLGNSDNWPWFERADFLDELKGLADEAFDKKTFEGYWVQ